MEEKDMFNAKQAAAYLGVSESEVRLWRSQGRGPRYFREGNILRYRKCDIEEWISSRLSEPQEGDKGPASRAS